MNKIVFFLIFILISCSSNDNLRIKITRDKDFSRENDVFFKIKIINDFKNQSKINFDKSKLYFQCIDKEDSSYFVVENEKHEQEKIYNLYHRSGAKIDLVDHCPIANDLILEPYEKVYLGKVNINVVSLKISQNDKKIRLCYIQDNKIKIKSNWIYLE